MALQYITRHTVPSKYDAAPFGTLCYSMLDEDEYKLYVQLSKVEESRWEPIGYLLEVALEEKLESEELILELLDLVDRRPNKSFIRLAEILIK